MKLQGSDRTLPHFSGPVTGITFSFPIRTGRLFSYTVTRVAVIHYNYGSNGKLHQCGGEAYTWNPRSKTFGFNPALTKKLTRATCSLVPNKAG